MVLLGGSHNTDPQCQSGWSAAGCWHREPCMPRTPLLSLLHPQVVGTCPGPSSGRSCTPLQLMETGHLCTAGLDTAPLGAGFSPQHVWGLLKRQLCGRNGQTL